MRSERLLLTITVLAAMLLVSACRQSNSVSDTVDTGARVFDVTGVVREPLQDGQILIEHDEIPGFMPAMTMPFYVRDEAAASGLMSGDRVRFRFVVGETSHADRFLVVGKEQSSGAASSTTNHAVSKSERLKMGDRLEDFSLVDHLGEPLNAAELDGRFTLITFIFTRCPVPEFCPAMMTRFASLQERIAGNTSMRRSVRLLGVTLDPEFDRPAILRDYAEAMGADPSLWRLATGEKAAVDDLVRAFTVHSEKRNGTLDHTLCTALIGPDRRVIEMWRGNGWKVDEVFAAMVAAAECES